jgi:hypothetical protein
MSQKEKYRRGSPDGWSVVGHHDWDATETLETTLRRTLDTIDDNPGEGELYQYIDVEALFDVLSPETTRGASEVHFEYGRHDVRVSQDGTIAVR